LTAHLLTSADGTNGHGSTLTLEKERFIGIEDPDVTGRCDYTGVSVPGPLRQMLALEPVSGGTGACRELGVVRALAAFDPEPPMRTGGVPSILAILRKRGRTSAHTDSALRARATPGGFSRG
jgi:hypothetical protein